MQNFLTDSKEESIIDFLKKVKVANATVKAIVIILDNYSSHHAVKVKETAQELDIYLVHLPPYSPDLNSIELGLSLRGLLATTYSSFLVIINAIYSVQAKVLKHKAVASKM